jgi:hypothetical protein
MITIVIHQAPHLIEEAELVNWVEVLDEDELPQPMLVVRKPKLPVREHKARITIVVE